VAARALRYGQRARLGRRRHLGDIRRPVVAVITSSEEAEAAADLQAERATKAAEDAVAAQGQIATETKRLADATERKWEAADENPWQIDRDGGVDRLRNLTATTKYQVRLRGGLVRLMGGAPSAKSPETLRPRSTCWNRGAYSRTRPSS